MAIFLSVTSFAFLIMETLVGIVANGFIVLISCIDWSRSRKLSPIDLIMTCLGLSRFLWQAIAMLQVTMFSFFLSSTYLKYHLYTLINMVWFFTYNVNIVFAVWLSILYFVKITTFSHPIFLLVKQRFPSLVPRLLLGSVAFCTFMTVTIIVIRLSGSDIIICDPYKLLLNNSDNSEVKMTRSCKQLIFLFSVPALILSVIFLSSTILLIISLWKHIRHLQLNGISSTRDLNTSAHLTAIKALTSFAILYSFSLVTVYLQVILSWRSFEHSWKPLLFQTMSAVYPSGHAVILILINPKLKEAWVRIIHHLKCQLSEAPA